MLAATAVVLVLTCVAGFLFYVKISFKYWKRRGVPHIRPEFPFGNPVTSRAHLSESLQAQYLHLKSQGHKYGGCYLLTSPIFLPIHLEVTKDVMTRNFHHFMNRGIYCNEESDPLSAHLFSLAGEKWRNLRHKLSPTFTSGKMKKMFQVLVECSRELENRNLKEVCPIKELLQNFTTDVIGSCAFGIQCNSFGSENSQFLKMARKVINATRAEKAKRLFIFTFPNLSKRLGLALTSKDVSEFYLDIVKQTVRYREEKKVVRKDFLQILIV